MVRADDFDKIKNNERQLLDSIRKNADKSDCFDGYFGLAFSGGGIRSATFNLGILQALAKAELLRKVDYLSTVSGGGYIGSWLTAQIARKRQEKIVAFMALKLAKGELSEAELTAAVCSVEDEIAQDALKSIEDEVAQVGHNPEPQSIRFLREYSNYLTPRTGLFSGDTLASVANYLRNVYLNQLTLFMLLIAVLLAPRLIYSALACIENYPVSWFFNLSILWLVVILGLIPAIFLSARELNKNKVAEQFDSKLVNSAILLPAFFAALALSDRLYSAAHSDSANLAGALLGGFPVLSKYWDTHPALVCGAAGLLLYGGTYFLITLSVWAKAGFPSIREEDHEFKFKLMAPFIAGAVGGFLCYLLSEWFAIFGDKNADGQWANLEQGRWFAIGIGTLIILKILSLVIVLHIGLVSRGFSEQNREWWGRLGGMAIWLGLMWLSWFGIAVYGPIIRVWAESWVLYLGGLGWLLSTVAGIWFGRSDISGSQQNLMLDKALSFTPYIFIGGLLLVLACGIDYLYGGISAEKPPAPKAVAVSGEVKANLPVKTKITLTNEANQQTFEKEERLEAEFKAAMPFSSSMKIELPHELSFQKLADSGLKKMAKVESDKLVWGFSICMVLFIILGWRVDINLFSMHHFYRNRLARCYLGASRAAQRRPSPFTGFDPDDDLSLDECRHRPYHLVNTAINLVSGEELAWQQRKSGSFLFSPLASGFELKESKGVIGGYRETKRCMCGPEYENGVNLGTAFAISGAAASPNMGYHSSPGLAFLMTMFNVRLGRWCGNPAAPFRQNLWTTLTMPLRQEKPGEEWKALGPTFSAKYLISELLGMSDEKSPFVYLSDGGHFENLGLYELVRRQSKLIVVCDAGADPDMGFEDLGNAIRKCKIDFGAEIDIDINPLKLLPGSRNSGKHWQKGGINYSNGGKAVLFYVKASLTDAVSAEIQQYAFQETSFPHQTTADQWFDEAQFESYRKLGEFIGENVAGEIRQAMS